MNEFKWWHGAVIAIAVIALIIKSFPPAKKAVLEYDYELQKIEEDYSYGSLKKVEDVCRAMIASYQADYQTYLQYAESDNLEKQEWAEQARMRANRTAATYNEYIRKNSFIWGENVPRDIDENLEFIE